MRALLDVNSLIALLDQAHLHHGAVRSFMLHNADAGWATCPITQNGCLRVMAQPAYPGGLSVGQVAALLAAATGADAHEFWACDVSLLDPAVAETERLLGPGQVTDAYLLALAATRGGRLVTFDRRIDPGALPCAQPFNLLTL
ncbi:MAG: hypothetical protein LBD51_06945 [Bifidobacteriaceae bacterium]|jgi:toxin-antitoxin system PIN domain toxin|nr:hypothetical protein [Bifidobacteriaceae bacterium]